MKLRRRIVYKLREWLENRHLSWLEEKDGFLHECPWCRQTAQDGDGYLCEPWREGNNEAHEGMKLLVCGVCGGKSIWRLVGESMQYVNAIEAPKPEFKADEDFDIPDSWTDFAERLRSAHRTIATMNSEVCQILAPTIGLPRYVDRKEKYPDATEADGYIVQGYSAVSMAKRAVDEMETLTRQRIALNAELIREKRRRE